jgi:5-methylcytosine-specific restriction endonuclease McrA
MTGLPLPDQIEVLLAEHKTERDRLTAALKAEKDRLTAEMTRIIRAAKPALPVIAEIYWRFDEVPSTVLWPGAQGAYPIARQYPYWYWTCERCGAETPVTSRSELQDRRRGRLSAASCNECRRPGAAWAEARWAEHQARVAELRTMPYREYLQTPEWQQRRKAALKRAGYACQVCNRKRQLHVHHRTYERRGDEYTADLIVLCDDCHALYHGKGLLADPPDRD